TESLEDLAARVQQLVKPEIPATLLEKLRKLPDLAKMAGYTPRLVKRGLCQEVVSTDDADLFTLPVIQCWPHDGDLDSEPPHPVPEWFRAVEDTLRAATGDRETQTGAGRTAEAAREQTNAAGVSHPSSTAPGASLRGTGRYITL